MSSSALLVTSDDVLLDDVLRLSAAAGLPLDVAHDTSAAVRGWATAGVVLVGADLVAALAAAGPVRREQVHVLTPAPAPADVLRSALRVGAHDVLELPAAEDFLLELLTDVADGGAGRAVTIGVVGGSGGAGASTFAAAIAVTAASGSVPTLLLDTDPLGAGLDRLVALDEAEGVRWDSLADNAGRLGSRSLRQALPRRGDLGVLTWGSGRREKLGATEVREVLSAAQRGHALVVADLPRCLASQSREVISRCDTVVLVVSLAGLAVVAAVRMAGVLLECGRPVAVVVRGSSAEVDADQVAAVLGLPLLAAMPDQRRLDEWTGLGLGPVHNRRGPLSRAARAALSHCAPAGGGAA